MKQDNNNKQSFGRTNNSITASFHIWLGDFLYDSCQTGQMDDHAMLSHRWEKKKGDFPFLGFKKKSRQKWFWKPTLRKRGTISVQQANF